MRDTETNKRGESFEETSGQGPNDIEELRKLLLGSIQARMDILQERLNSPELRAEDLSQVLPEAILLRSACDKKIDFALKPITENIIKSSIKKDRKILADALFPVIGPAIRKAIASAIQSMIQSFNQVLEHSLSLKALKWRLEALRTNKPFAEIVLLHTLVYQVEQLFLIQRDTGLVLQHVPIKTSSSQDPDLVSGMLTAIKDFVTDSFGSEEAPLETLRVGDRSVWIEHGPKAFLAAVIRGQPPLDFQSTLREAVEEIHLYFEEALDDFDGDTSPFEQTRYVLDDCLQFQFQDAEKKGFPFIWLLIVICLGLLALWPISAYRHHLRVANLAERLQTEPGIVITAFKDVNDKYQISGLRDPLSTDPGLLIRESGLDSDSFIFHFEPYHSSHPSFIISRLYNIIDPPDSVRIRYQDGILYADGSAFKSWQDQTRKLAHALPWINELQFGGLVDIDSVLATPKTVNMDLQGTTLTVSGKAPHRWIEGLQGKAYLLPGITEIRSTNLVDMDMVELKEIKRRLESRAVFFEKGSTQLDAGEIDKIPLIAEEINEFRAKAQRLNQKFRFEITGYADASGSKKVNLDICLSRALSVLTLLKNYGLDPDMFVIESAPANFVIGHADPTLTMALNRRVNIKIKQIEKTD